MPQLRPRTMPGRLAGQGKSGKVEVPDMSLLQSEYAEPPTASVAWSSQRKSLCVLLYPPHSSTAAIEAQAEV